ncbi:MAG: hypothetical protein AAF389_20515 [Gemmatimonadota bacterium]
MPKDNGEERSQSPQLSARTFARFIEGRLSPVERASVLEVLRTSQPDREVLADMVRALGPTPPPDDPPS